MPRDVSNELVQTLSLLVGDGLEFKGFAIQLRESLPGVYKRVPGAAKKYSP